MRYDKHVVGENLKRERTSHQWSQAWVARQTGICVRTLSRAENGQGMSASKLKVLANFYGVQLTNLYCERKSTSFGDIITPIPFYRLGFLFEDDSFLNMVQRLAILCFKNFVKDRALLSKADASILIKEISDIKYPVTEQDIIKLCQSVNRWTLNRVEMFSMGQE